MPWSSVKLGFPILPQPGARLCSQMSEQLRFGTRGAALFTRSSRLEPPSGGLSQLPLIQKLAQPGIKPPGQARRGLGVGAGEEAQEHESGMKNQYTYGFGPENRPGDHSSPYQNHRAPSSLFSLIGVLKTIPGQRRSMDLFASFFFPPLQ